MAAIWHPCGVHHWPPHQNCTCTEAEIGAGTAAASAPDRKLRPARLSQALSAKRLQTTTVKAGDLEAERQLGPRFVPSGPNETFSSIFTWWNLLDGLMLAHEPQHRFKDGYVRELQLRRMYELVSQEASSSRLQAAAQGRRTATRTYCEVGLNGGHSAVAMLLSSPHLEVHSFDLLAWKYSKPVAELLGQSFAGRFWVYRPRRNYSELMPGGGKELRMMQLRCWQSLMR